MSLSSTSNRVVFTGDAVSVDFAYNKLVYEDAHLTVYLDGELQASGYTVTGVPGSSTGVTFDTAPGTGVQVLLLREVPLTQLSDYDVGGAFPSESVEKSLDLGVMGLQQFDEKLDRAVTLPVESTLTATNLPDPADPLNYGKGVKIAGDGSGLDTFNINAGNISGTVTTKGDLHIFGASTEDRLAIGANNTILTADSTQAKGLKWTSTITSPTLSGTMAAAGATITSPTIDSPTITGAVQLNSGILIFPAVQNPSGGANALDDYEEGTWTPSVGGSATYTSRAGFYTKIGRQVTYQCYLQINSIGSGSTSLISGLPFTTAQFATGSVFWTGGAASPDYALAAANGTATTVTLYGITAPGANLSAIALMGNSTEIAFTVTVFV